MMGIEPPDDDDAEGDILEEAIDDEEWALSSQQQGVLETNWTL